MRGFIRITIAVPVPRRVVSNTRHVNTRKSRTSDVQDYKRQPSPNRLHPRIFSSLRLFWDASSLQSTGGKKMRHFLSSQWISRKTRDLLAIASQIREVVS